jgi:hypothetical protein
MPFDAQILATFAAAVHPEARPLADAQAQNLKGILARRRQLNEMITAERNRLQRAGMQVRDHIRSHMNHGVPATQIQQRRRHYHLPVCLSLLQVGPSLHVPPN